VKKIPSFSLGQISGVCDSVNKFARKPSVAQVFVFQSPKTEAVAGEISSLNSL
jgi:hypothetical protein